MADFSDNSGEKQTKKKTKIKQTKTNKKQKTKQNKFLRTLL